MLQQIQMDLEKHGEIGETSSNGFRKACKFIYIQALDPNQWNHFKRIQVSMMKLTPASRPDPNKPYRPVYKEL